MQLVLAGFGNNHLEKIIYNPTTGGCYDLLEDYINLNQGTESTVLFDGTLKMEKKLSSRYEKRL
jgi:hypothetical protein